MKKIILIVSFIFSFSAYSQKETSVQTITNSDEIVTEKPFENSSFVKLKIKSIPISKVIGLKEALDTAGGSSDFSGNPSDLNQQGATNGQVIKWNGTIWAPANDSGGSAGTNNPDSVGGQPAAYYLDYINFVNTPVIPDVSNFYTKTQTDSIKQFVVDSLSPEINKFTFPRDTLSSSRAFLLTDRYKTLCEYDVSRDLTIEEDLGFTIGDKIILQCGNGAGIDIIAGSNVVLNFGASTLSITSTAGNVATRVLQYVGVDVNNNDVWLLSNE